MSKSGKEPTRGRHPSGGITLNIAMSLWLARTPRTYSQNGRLNSSTVGRNTGHGSPLPDTISAATCGRAAVALPHRKTPPGWCKQQVGKNPQVGG